MIPCAELSLNSVVGLTMSGTMKFKGFIDEQDVVIMICWGDSQLDFTEAGGALETPYDGDHRLCSGCGFGGSSKRKRDL